MGTLAVFVASVVSGWRVQYHAIVFRGRSDTMGPRGSPSFACHALVVCEVVTTLVEGNE